MKISIQILLCSTILLTRATAQATEALVPRLDQALLHTPAEYASKVTSIVKSLEANCASPAASKNPSLIDACQLEEIVSWFRNEASATKISLAEPLMDKVFSKDLSEETMWRHYLRTFMLRKSLASAAVFFSRTAGAQRNYVGMVSFPMTAGSLDQFSLWSRLITMSRSQVCQDSRDEYCDLLRSQLIVLARQAWRAAKGDETISLLSPEGSALREIAAAVSQRLERMSIAELANLEDMDNLTSAGLGIPFLRQVVVQLKSVNESLSDIDLGNLRKTILLTDIKVALDQFEEPASAWSPNEQSVSALVQELQRLSLYVAAPPQT